MGKVKKFVKGEIRLKVESLEIEKFLNLSTKAKVRMWDIEREDFTTISFSMYQEDFKHLKRIVRKTGSRTKVRRKNGMNFIYSKINRRKFFAIGSLVFLLLIFIFSSLILRIEITGNKNVENKRIINCLEKSGITYGKLKYGYDLRQIETSILEDIKEVSVVTIKFIGTKVKIDVIERTMPPTIDSVDIPRDIIAKKEGVISGITALKGARVVTIGDYVKKGDILIAGVVKDDEGIPLKVTEATGKVTAKTWVEIEESIDFDYRYDKYTGREYTRTYYSAFNKILALKHENKFQKYDKIVNEKDISIFGYKMPIKKFEEVYKEKKVESKIINETQGLNILKNKIEDKSKNLISKDSKIVDKIESKTLTDKGVTLKIIYITEESIGEVKDIVNTPKIGEEVKDNKKDES
ncbi:MAG: sporulation protein YqfD [Clostridium sp.]